MNLTINDIQHGKMPDVDPITEPVRVIPVESNWWDVNSAINLTTFGFPDNFDASNNFLLYFYIDDNVKTILKVGLTLKFQEFRGYTKPLAHTHTVTIAAHTHGVTTTDHTHTVPISQEADTAVNIAAGGYPVAYLRSVAPTIFVSDVAFWGGAPRTMVSSETSSNGGASSLTSASGGSSTPTSSSGAGAEYGIYEDTYPAAVTLLIDGVDISTNLGGPWNPTAISNLFSNLDITPFVKEPGLHTLELTTSQRGRCLPLLYVKSIISR